MEDYYYPKSPESLVSASNAIGLSSSTNQTVLPTLPPATPPTEGQKVLIAIYPWGHSEIVDVLRIHSYQEGTVFFEATVGVQKTIKVTVE